jgi:hypothetical protein
MSQLIILAAPSTSVLVIASGDLSTYCRSTRRAPCAVLSRAMVW